MTNENPQKNSESIEIRAAISLLAKSLQTNEYPSNYLTELLRYLKIKPADDFSRKINKGQQEKLERITKKLNEQMPVEYIVGSAYFYGLRFKVNKNVLIPRVDTEPLVTNAIKALEQIPKPVTIIDVGTGSGALIISLANNLDKKNHYWATDISEKALEIAQKNAEKLRQKNNFEFFNVDTVPAKVPETNSVYIITNPPYIPDEEIKTLPISVANYEPMLALKRNEEMINILQEYINMLLIAGKKVNLAIEYSLNGKMIHRYSTLSAEVSLKELLRQ